MAQTRQATKKGRLRGDLRTAFSAYWGVSGSETVVTFGPPIGCPSALAADQPSGSNEQKKSKWQAKEDMKWKNNVFRTGQG